MSVQWGIITAVMPPGGWHYPQKLSSGDTVKISAFSFEEILENMLDFRRRHLDLCGAVSATIESVRADLKSYLCANFRQNCADSAEPPVQAIGVSVPQSAYHRPIDRGGSWIADLGNTRIEKVDAALAAQRAHICATCPQNIRWASACAPCNDNILVRIQNAKGSVHTPYDRHLFLCRVYGHLNEVAVWLADTHSEQQSQPPPAVCWKAQNNG